MQDPGGNWPELDSLIGPIALRMLETSGEEPGAAYAFSSYQAILKAQSETSQSETSLSAVLRRPEVVDLRPRGGTVSEQMPAELMWEPPSFEGVKLVTTILVLEQLEKPWAFLAALGEELSHVGREIALLIVTADVGFQPLLSAAGQVAGAGKSPFRVRSLRSYEAMFRDVGLQVRACEPIHLREKGGPGGPLPPVWVWRLSARQCRAGRGRHEVLAAAVSQRLPSALAEALKAIDELKHIECHVVAPGNVVLRGRTLGGQLTVILEGTAVIRDRVVTPASQSLRFAKRKRPTDGDSVASTGDAEQSAEGDSAHVSARPPSRDGLSLIPFRAGTVFGELEMGPPGGQPIHLSHDVVAGVDGCSIAVISAETAARVLSGGSGLPKFFYENLRDRMQLLIWRQGVTEVRKGWPPEDIDDEAFGYVTPEVRKAAPQNIWRAARSTLWGSVIEKRWRGRDLDDDVTFLDMDQAVLLFQPTTRPDNADPFHRAFDILHWLRIVDTYHLPSLRSEGESKPDARVAQKAKAMAPKIVERACNSILLPYVRPGQRQHFAEIVNEFKKNQAAFANGDWSTTPSLKTFLAGAKLGLDETNPGGMQALADLQIYLVRASMLWHSIPRKMRFVVIRDSQALREIVLGNVDDLRRTVVPRGAYLRKTAVDLDAEVEAVRQLDYLQLLDGFLEKDLSVSRRLFFSDEIATWKS